MRKTMGLTVAASIALFSTPAFAAEARTTDAHDALARTYDGYPDRDARDDGGAATDRARTDDAPGAGAGEPTTSAMMSREQAMQQEEERRFVEQVWTGP